MNHPVYIFTYYRNGSNAVWRQFNMTKPDFVKLVKNADQDSELFWGPQAIVDTAGEIVEQDDGFWQLPEDTQFKLCVEREREKYAVGITVLRADAA